jgi:hypothetical protein
VLDTAGDVELLWVEANRSGNPPSTMEGAIVRLVVLGLLTCVLTAGGCSQQPQTTGPRSSSGSGTQADWLAALISQLENEPVRNPPAIIASYTYKGETVYYVPPYCCDAMSTLYDSEGNVLCSPDGGFTGAGDGGCADFFETRTDRKVVWEDPRQTR